jgi:hypothetical protein
MFITLGPGASTTKHFWSECTRYFCKLDHFSVLETKVYIFELVYIAYIYF